MSARLDKALLALFLKSLAQWGKRRKQPIPEIVVTVDDATLVGRPLDALKHDPNARRQPRDLFDVDAGGPTTAPAVHMPATLIAEPIGRRPPKHEAIHAIVEVGRTSAKLSADDVRNRAAVGGALLQTMVEWVEPRMSDLIRGDQ